jgi:hypothetical protein
MSRWAALRNRSPANLLQQRHQTWDGSRPSRVTGAHATPESATEPFIGQSQALDEDAHQGLADRYGAEAHQDQIHAQAEEQPWGRSPHQYQLVADAQL